MFTTTTQAKKLIISRLNIASMQIRFKSKTLFFIGSPHQEIGFSGVVHFCQMIFKIFEMCSLFRWFHPNSNDKILVGWQKPLWKTCSVCHLKRKLFEPLQIEPLCSNPTQNYQMWNLLSKKWEDNHIQSDKQFLQRKWSLNTSYHSMFASFLVRSTKTVGSPGQPLGAKVSALDVTRLGH